MDFIHNIDMECVNAGIGLIFLMLVNVVLGSLKAKILEEFDWKVMVIGLLKGAIVSVCITIVYLVGLMNAQLIVANINGVEMNLAIAVTTLIMSAFVWYGYQSIQKIANILNIGGRISIKDTVKEEEEENGTGAE